MSRYPLDHRARKALRASHAAEIRAAAEVKARRFGRSISCGGGGDPWFVIPLDGPHTCRNDGSGCLCECHDPREDA